MAAEALLQLIYLCVYLFSSNDTIPLMDAIISGG